MSNTSVNDKLRATVFEPGQRLRHLLKLLCHNEWNKRNQLVWYDHVPKCCILCIIEAGRLMHLKFNI